MLYYHNDNMTIVAASTRGANAVVVLVAIGVLTLLSLLVIF